MAWVLFCFISFRFSFSFFTFMHLYTELTVQWKCGSKKSKKKRKENFFFTFILQKLTYIVYANRNIVNLESPKFCSLLFPLSPLHHSAYTLYTCLSAKLFASYLSSSSQEKIVVFQFSTIVFFLYDSFKTVSAFLSTFLSLFKKKQKKRYLKGN